ncbi:hypothetical protein RCH23_002753 [Cryobacterium sp. CAN_C3]|nr:hypothetical protein [Cryobacterium sp. CAN_C3]
MAVKSKKSLERSLAAADKFIVFASAEAHTT